MRKIYLLFSFVFIFRLECALGATVVELTVDPTLAIISSDPLHIWKPREKVCFYRERQLKTCGWVVQLTTKGASIQFPGGVPLQIGDEARFSQRTISSANPAKNEISSWGPVLGLSSSSLSKGSTGLEYTNRSGFVAGIHWNLPIGSNFSVSPEILYAQRGGLVIPKSTEKTFYNYSYIAVPIDFKSNWNWGALAPYISAGPYVAMMLSAKIATESIVGTTSTSTEVDNKSGVKSLDYGANLGLGVEFLISQETKIQCGFRIGIGIAKLDVQSTTTPTRMRFSEVMIAMLF